MPLVDLTGDEHSIIDTVLAAEIRRQREMQKLDVNKRNPNYGAAAASQTTIDRLQRLRAKLDAAPTAPAPSATPTVATAPGDCYNPRPGR